MKIYLVRMRLKMEDDQTSPLAKLNAWREKKYAEIDQEYDRRREVLLKDIAKHENEISRAFEHIQGLMDEGDVSIDQVQRIEQTIESLTNKMNNLFVNNEGDLVGTDIQMGGTRFRVVARVKCGNSDLYALESEKALLGYTGRCPQCDRTHAKLEHNRGLYALVKSIHEKVFNS